MNTLYFALTGLACGMLASLLFRDSLSGLVRNALLRILGSIVAGWAAVALDFGEGELLWQLFITVHIAVTDQSDKRSIASIPANVSYHSAKPNYQEWNWPAYASLSRPSKWPL